jgi:hypothetical protein
VIRRLLLVLPLPALALPLVAYAATLGVASTRLTATTSATSVAASTCTLEPDADTDADELAPLTNFGASADLRVRSMLASDRRSFVQFGVAGCSIPTSAEVKTAVLELYLSAAPTASRTYGAHRVTAAWSESTLTWAAQPATAGAATSSVATGTTSGTTLSWNVLADVTAFVAGTATNNGWQIRDATEDSLADAASTFGSGERAAASQRPKLTITYYP